MLGVLQQTTTYVPLRTPIDGDRDYSDLTGLGRCNCGYQGLGETEGMTPGMWLLTAALLAGTWWNLSRPMR